MAQQAGQGDLFAEFKKQIPADWQTDSGTDADGTKWVSASKSVRGHGRTRRPSRRAGAGRSRRGACGRHLLDQAVAAACSASPPRSTPPGTRGRLSPMPRRAYRTASPWITLSSIFQVENRLTLPGTIKDNNATEVQGNTLIWRPNASGYYRAARPKRRRAVGHSRSLHRGRCAAGRGGGRRRRARAHARAPARFGGSAYMVPRRGDRRLRRRPARLRPAG